MEDYDDYYEDEGGNGRYGYEDEYEEVEEEEEPRKPSAEELGYLEFRQRIKEQIRKKMQRDNGSKSSSNKRLPTDSYGSFFGPSQPVIAQRVIQESKPLLDNPRMAVRVVNGYSTNVKDKKYNTTSSKGRSYDNASRAQKEVQKKVQQLKNTRDYSFLFSENMEIPGPSNESKRHFAPPSKPFNSGQVTRNSQVSQKVKPPCEILQRNNHNSRENRKPVTGYNQKLPKAEYSKTHASNHSTSGPAGLRKNVSVNFGRPESLQQHSAKGHRMPSNVGVESKVGPSSQRNGIVQKNNRASSSHMYKSPSLSVGKSDPPPSYKQQSSLHSSAANQRLEMKRPVEPFKANAVPKRPISSEKLEVSRAVKQIPGNALRNDDRPKKKPPRPFSDDEDTQALLEIRKMFNTRRFAGRDDDDSDMEANFDDILKEERRSAKIGRKEDEEQLRLIEEEERTEQMRKMAKKRKLRD